MRRLGESAGVWHVAGFRLTGGSPRLVAAGDHEVSIWDPVSGARTAAFDVDWGINDIVVCRAHGADPVLAVASDTGIQWLTTDTGAPCYGPSTDDTIWGMAVRSARGDGETVFGAGYGGPYPIHRWDASTGTMLEDLGEHNDHITAVMVLTLPDGTEVVAAGGWSHTICRWDPATNRRYGRPLDGLEGVVHAMDTVLLPDGRLLLASADSAGEVRRWDAVTGEPIGSPIKAHPNAIAVLAIAARGNPELLTSGDDEVIRRWDAITGELLAEVAEGFDPVLLTIDGALTLAAGGSHGLALHPFQL
jgi:WD40 repeat protein